MEIFNTKITVQVIFYSHGRYEPPSSLLFYVFKIFHRETYVYCVYVYAE